MTVIEPVRIKLSDVDRSIVVNDPAVDEAVIVKVPPAEMAVPVVIKPVWVNAAVDLEAVVVPTAIVTAPLPACVRPPKIRLFLSVMEIAPVPLPVKVTAP